MKPLNGLLFGGSGLPTAAAVWIWEFAKFFHRSPDELGPEHIREFQAHLFRVRELPGNSVAQRTAALRFLFVPFSLR
jgi:hypothetical protein